MRTHALPLALLAAVALAGCRHELRCPEGETACGDRCVSLLTDADNCGSCGVAASPLEVCRGAALGCAPGIEACDGVCTDLARDPLHCGACPTSCGDGELCLTDAEGTRCVTGCPDRFTACDGACVALDADRLHCGACGAACRPGQTCRAGTCAPELVVACYASQDVRPVTAALEPAGPARAAQGGPTTLLVDGLNLFSGNGFPAGVTLFPLDDRLPTRVLSLAGNDVQGLATWGGLLLVSNSDAQTVVVVDPAAGRAVDEVALSRESVFPHGLAVVGATAYVSLYGDGPGGFSGSTAVTGQAIARVDLSEIPGCMAAGRAGCLTLHEPISLLSHPDAASPGAYPFPGALAVHGTKVYALLSNLERADCGGGWMAYCKPAGNGRLAVIDTAAEDAVSIVDLGAGCKNPGDIEISGETAWVTCGSFAFADVAPGAVLPVDLSGPAPVPLAPVTLSGIVPGGLAICGGIGYVTDQASGAVLRFDPASGQVEEPVTVCPTVYFAWASDVACPRP